MGIGRALRRVKKLSDGAQVAHAAVGTTSNLFRREFPRTNISTRVPRRLNQFEALCLDAFAQAFVHNNLHVYAAVQSAALRVAVRRAGMRGSVAARARSTWPTSREFVVGFDHLREIGNRITNPGTEGGDRIDLCVADSVLGSTRDRRKEPQHLG